MITVVTLYMAGGRTYLHSIPRSLHLARFDIMIEKRYGEFLHSLPENEMKLLALDTSHSACSLALMIDDEIHLSHQVAPMQQAQLVLPLLEALLLTHNVTLKDLDALAFGCGPGSFTGVRIAASVMQGLAYATDLPLIRISSLAATAQAAFDDLGWPNLMVGTDARIQEVYWGLYQADKNGLVELEGKEKVCPPQMINTLQLQIGMPWVMPGRYTLKSCWKK